MYRLSALRVVSAYRTVSDEAACVIAGMIPIDILTRERQKLYRCDKEQATNAKADYVRMATALESLGEGKVDIPGYP